MVTTLLCLVGGLALLYFGADYLVKAGSSLALKLKVPPARHRTYVSRIWYKRT